MKRGRALLEGGRRLLAVQPNLFTMRMEGEVTDVTKRGGKRRVKSSGNYSRYPFVLTEKRDCNKQHGRGHSALMGYRGWT